jgi:hypothetical protein
MSDLLPLMLLGGGMGGDPNNPNAMSSMLPLLLLGDSSSALSDADATAICDGVDASLTVPCAAAVGDYTTASALCVSGAADYDTCVSGLSALEDAIYTAGGKTKSSSTSDLMVMMMMGGMGGAGGAGGMNSMLPLLLLGDGLGSGSGGMSDMLLPLMMMQQPQIDPATGQATAGGMGGMDPLMMMLLLD